MEETTTQFHLTEDTPPMQEPLLSDLGYLSDTVEAQQILAGMYICPPSTDDFTQEFLTCLQQSPAVSNGNKLT
jgi:hypothetical protein